jgi:eukaryotic-like serine/threonine-protein kinase
MPATRVALAPGTRLGVYEILTPIGAGGMGEVYQARDARLKRDVALKVLPDNFAQDTDRLARFQREAELLATLNHPNIAGIYGLEESNGVRALVLELVEGPTLADRIAKGPIPLDDALPIARQIAEALEAAHEKGVIHRDLKPANIKLRADDTVKVLDFGLAKMLDATPGGSSRTGSDVTESPTMMSPAMTQAGLILGTAAYMSPEQARGRGVDARTDIWAFGCVLSEMLTGQRAFPGETTSDAIAAILEREPLWDRLPTATPEPIRRLLRRCLAKDPKQRLRHIADARIELDEASAARTSPAPEKHAVHTSSSVWKVAAAVVVAGVAAAAVAWALKGTRSSTASNAVLARVLVAPAEPLPNDVQGLFAASPDGRQLVYVAGPDRERRLYLRNIDQFDSKAVPGSEGADFPIFSPDGQWLAFVADEKIKKVAVGGGVPQILCAVAEPQGLSWGIADDAIYFNPGRASGIRRVSAKGGTPVEVTRLARGELSHMYPDVLPDGSAVLFSDTSEIYAQSLKTGMRHRLGQGTSPHYLSTGHVAYVRDGVLYAVPFDASRLEVTGQPVNMLEGVSQTVRGGAAQLSFSRAGTMMYVSSNGPPQQDAFVWVDHDGTEKRAGALAGPVHAPRVSPDGGRIAAISGDGALSLGDGDVLLYDLTRETWNRFTAEGDFRFALWAPDGTRLALGSRKAGEHDVFTSSLDGTAREDLIKNAPTTFPLSWSPDGNYIALVTVGDSTSQDIAVLDRRDPGKLKVLLNSRFREGAPTFSSDSRWIAYVSDKSGRNEIYMRPIQGAGEEWTISSDGGTEPVWARNAPLLFYRHDDAMMVVDVVTTPAVSAGKPRRLFEKRFQPSPSFWPNYDVSSDGKRLLMIKHAEQAAPTQINVVLNWFEELKQRVPTK